MGNFRFPIKTKLPPGFINARILRDNFKRQQFKENEILVKSLKFIARNMNLPTKLRLEAQLKLNALPNYMRSTQIKEGYLVKNFIAKVYIYIYIGYALVNKYMIIFILL